ncbi:MAG TPA: DUF1194 domain-containing protein [Xanthobacteraceae bacterium]|nr:DUF1194 domain-containing protein [Xanthobacteraceae bacterium]
MRLQAWISFGLLAIATTGLTSWTAGLARPGPAAVKVAQAGEEVDVELVLAVDISYSMDTDEQQLQREGYAGALASREFLQALKEGIHGKVAITYVEWAGAFDQRVVVPWRAIDGPESADSFAADILRAPYRRASRTSISGALGFSKSLFETSGFKGVRRVIDVSGDGPNNNGPALNVVRDEVVAAGITINGLPIMLNRPNTYGFGDIEHLDQYYEDCVVGGPGAFVVPVRGRDKFKEATRTKLVLEIAGLQPEPKVIPAAATPPRVPCNIGERQWRDRWQN